MKFGKWRLICRSLDNNVQHPLTRNKEFRFWSDAHNAWVYADNFCAFPDHAWFVEMVGTKGETIQRFHPDGLNGYPNWPTPNN